MVKLVAGEAVILPFPETNLQSRNRRLALVVADIAVIPNALESSASGGATIT